MNPAAHVGDSDEAVNKNRQLLVAALDLPAAPVWMRQVHGADVLDAEQLKPGMAGDGVVTGAVNVVCGIQTADCLPLFLCSHDGRRIGLLHVGWRGLAAGIVESGLRALTTSPTDVLAWLGPAIGPRAFEVGEDVYGALVYDDPSAAAFAAGPAGKWHADLYRLVELRLARAGVSDCYYDRSLCTYSQPELFFSYRRERNCGRMASVIWKEEPV